MYYKIPETIRTDLDKRLKNADPEETKELLIYTIHVLLLNIEILTDKIETMNLMGNDLEIITQRIE